MKKLFNVSMLVMIVMAIPCLVSANGYGNPSTVNANTGSIQGIVSDASTGDPIQGASVSVGGNVSYNDNGNGNSPRQTETDSTGYYILNGISAGSTAINVEADGYELNSQGVQVVADDTVEADVTLTPVPPPPPPPPPPAQGSISGTVTDSSTGNPIAGASVSVTSNGGIQSYNGWGWAKAVTDSTGFYILNGVSAGSTLVYAQAQGYLTGYQTVNVIANSTAVANLSLTAIVQPSKGSVQGTVTDATTGLPLAGAYVYAESSSQGSGQYGPNCNNGGGQNGGSQYAQTDSTGFYTLSNLNAGNYDIVASDNGYQSQTQPATVTGNSTTEVDFALQSQVTTTGSITGIVSDASTGSPIVGATVFVSLGAENWYENLNYRQAQTDSTGSYELDGIPSGNQVVNAQKCGYVYSSQTVAVPANDTVTANFALVEGPAEALGTITGTVSDASTGLPLAGAEVFVRDSFSGRCFGSRDGSMFTLTDVNGNYSIYSVSTGTLYVIAEDSGYYVSKEQAVVLDDQTTVVNLSLSAYGQGSSFSTVQVNVTDKENTQVANIPLPNLIAFVPESEQVLPVSWKWLQ